MLIYAVSVCAHDEAAKRGLSYDGFGMRCIDAVRTVEELPAVEGPDCVFGELPADEYPRIAPLVTELHRHLAAAPTCLYYQDFTAEQIVQQAVEDHSRYFTAQVNGTIVAYLKLNEEGENYATCDQRMTNISGAYCLPEYRGDGTYHNLLAHVIQVLKAEGYEHLGVDYESFNPTARGFWGKHFTEYTNSLVRRLDEVILSV